MTALPARTGISDNYPNPSNSLARKSLGEVHDVLVEFFEKPELDLASATTCDIGGQLSTKLRITGTTTITSFGTNYRGPIQLRMGGALTITHNSTTLVCPGGVNITTEADDRLIAWPKATTSGTPDGWEVSYLPYAGSATPLVDAASAMVGTSKRYARADHVHPTAAIGVGQSWQNVTASRAVSTTYTNSTGRPIQVSVCMVSSASGGSAATITINGTVSIYGSADTTAGAFLYVTAIVPAGATYRATVTVGTASLVANGWAELR